MQSSMRFRTNVREAMARLGISQRALATKLSTSQPHINKILQGETQPSLELADRIADALGLELSDLVGSRRKKSLAG